MQENIKDQLYNMANRKIGDGMRKDTFLQMSIDLYANLASKFNLLNDSLSEFNESDQIGKIINISILNVLLKI